MTVTDIQPQAPAPVTFRRTVLVGVDDPLLDGGAVPPAPAPPLTVADVLADEVAPALPADGVLSRARLATAVASIALLLVAVAGMAWLRFGDARHVPGSEGPVPSVAITSSPTALDGGASVQVTVGAGAAVERVDLFVDGDWTGSDTTAPFEPEWEHRSEGTHEIKAKLTDSEGRVRYSGALEVKIGD
jgi:hypothetical protein